MSLIANFHGAPGAVALPLRQVIYSHHVARICGLSTRMVRYAAESGELRGYRDPLQPRAWRFFRHDVEQFLARRAAKCRTE
jgi:hypothetical protein